MSENEIDSVDENEMVTIELNLDRDELYKLMLMAHERDITLNQLVASILTEAMERLQPTGEI